MNYRFIGFAISLLLILVGIISNVGFCLLAGFVFLVCNLGASVDYSFRNKRQKILPILALVTILATIVAFVYLDYILFGGGVKP